MAGVPPRSRDDAEQIPVPPAEQQEPYDIVDGTKRDIVVASSCGGAT